MTAVKLTIHGTGTGTCSLTGKEAAGLTVTFDDGTLSESFLSWKGFQQLLGMKAAKNGKKTPAVPPGQPTGGPAAAPK